MKLALARGMLMNADIMLLHDSTNQLGVLRAVPDQLRGTSLPRRRRLRHAFCHIHVKFLKP